MVPNRLAFLALGAACVVAAAGGGYLANRHDTAVVAQPQAAETPETVVAQQPVQETEAVVVETAAPGGQVDAAQDVTRPRETSRPQAEEARRPQRRPGTAQARNLPAPRPSPERTAPVRADAEPVSTPVLPPDVVAPSPLPAVQQPEPLPVPAPIFYELTVPADSVVGLQIETTISSEQARVEDRVDGRVVRDVRVGGEVAIPAGSRAIGSVTLVEQGGKFKERARLGIRFHTLVLADGTRLPVTTETIYRDGDAPGNSSAAKIGGGAVAGAILGAILGGSKGAAVGATAGAGGGTAAVVAGDRSEASFPVGTELTARILSPVTVTLEK